MKWFDEIYKTDLELSGRYDTMRKALELLLEKKPTQGIIVETGCVRMPKDVGAGQSTVIFGDFCERNNYHLFTVDNNPDALYVAQAETQKYKTFITYVENDSIEFLKSFNQTIDFLYLDSMDVPEYSAPTATDVVQSQVHQLLEIEATFDKLSEQPIILLDDADFSNGGKVRLSRFFLKERGFKEIMSGKQLLFIK